MDYTKEYEILDKSHISLWIWCISKHVETDEIILKISSDFIVLRRFVLIFLHFYLSIIENVCVSNTFAIGLNWVSFSRFTQRLSLLENSTQKAYFELYNGNQFQICWLLLVRLKRCAILSHRYSIYSYGSKNTLRYVLDGATIVKEHVIIGTHTHTCTHAHKER